MLPDRVLAAFAVQAGHCARMGAPFTAHLCRRLPALIAPESATGRWLSGFGADPEEGALALRLCGALHRLVRAGRVPALAALYPPAAETGAALDGVLSATLAEHDGTIRDLIAAGPPQTNEIGRAACLIGPLMMAARETGLPLTLWEIGSSAGLNLILDRYRFTLGAGRVAGPAASPVAIRAEWQGAAPPIAPIRIASRRGADRAPLDPRSAEAREALLSFVWPDQPARGARTAAALALAAADPPPIDRADAADWVEDRLAGPAAPGTLRVLMHSITWQYLPQEHRARIRAAMAAAGAAARAGTPLAWIAFERDETPGSAALTLTLWPGGRRRMMARCDFHGASARWLTR